jgi:hypothetical protein
MSQDLSSLNLEELRSHLESLTISNELLRTENQALSGAKRQVEELQLKVQSNEGYTIMINKLRRELTEYACLPLVHALLRTSLCWSLL